MATRVRSVQPEPTLPAAPSPMAGYQTARASPAHRLAQGSRRVRPSIEVREREEAPLVEARRVEHLGIPVLALLIEEAGRRGHRDAGDAPAQPLGGEELADGPPPRRADRGRARREPSELGRPVGRVQRAAGARPHGRLVEPPAEPLGLARAPCVRVHVQRGRGPPRPVEAEEAVPERGDADGRDVAGRREHGVDARRRGLEQALGIVLHAAVRGDPRVVLDLPRAISHRRAGIVVERGAGRGAADVEGENHDGRRG